MFGIFKEEPPSQSVPTPTVIVQPVQEALSAPDKLSPDVPIIIHDSDTSIIESGGTPKSPDGEP